MGKLKEDYEKQIAEKNEQITFHEQNVLKLEKNSQEKQKELDELNTKIKKITADNQEYEQT